MIKLLRFLRWHHYLLILILIGLVFMQVRADLQLPQRIANILTNAIPTEPGAALNPDGTNNIVRYGLEMLGFVAISVIATILVALIASFIAAQYSNDVRQNIYKKVQEFSFEEIEKFSTASLITRSTNDVTQIQSALIMILRVAFSAPLMAIQSITQVRQTSGPLSMVVLFAVIFVVLFLTVVILILTPKFKKIQTLTDNLNLVTRENLTGIRVIRAHDASKIEEEKFQEVNETFRKTSTFANRTASLVMPGLMFTMSMATLFVTWIGVMLVSDNLLQLPEITMFQQYANMVIMSFIMLTFLLIQLPRAQVSAKRINEILDTTPRITNQEVINQDISNKGKVVFNNVSFKYPDALEDVLKNISFTANPGETVAFIGSTGSGKSTLVNLVPRFYDVTEGSILIDDVDVKEYSQIELRKKLGYVPQKGFLFSGTILSNLKYGKKDPTKEEINEALDIACASEFVSRLEDGINSKISQGGKNVSGGQRQRLSIARAVIKKPSIFIFDDSFSALDYKTDLLVREKLNNSTKNVTKLIVAQRIGTIMNADKIIVLDKGAVCGIGTHKQLLKECEVYKEIAYSQLSKEELENE